MASFTYFLEFFVPLFVAIDAPGLVPLFLGVTGGMSIAQRRRISFQAVAAAALVAIAFMFLGNRLFLFLHITESDFKIAGGLILLVLSILDLLIQGKPAVNESDMIGIVPLAMPMIAGPATLTTTLVLGNRPDGYAMTSLSLAVNFLILLGFLAAAGHLSRFVGTSTLRAVSKLVMVLLAAIAVNFIRSGIQEIIVQSNPPAHVMILPNPPFSGGPQGRAPAALASAVLWTAAKSGDEIR